MLPKFSMPKLLMTLNANRTHVRLDIRVSPASLTDIRYLIPIRACLSKHLSYSNFFLNVRVWLSKSIILSIAKSSCICHSSQARLNPCGYNGMSERAWKWDTDPGPGVSIQLVLQIGQTCQQGSSHHHTIIFIQSIWPSFSSNWSRIWVISIDICKKGMDREQEGEGASACNQ